MDEKKTEKKKMKRSTKIIITIICVLLGLVLAAVITVAIWGKVLLAKIPRMNADVETMSQEEIDNIRNETDPTDPNFDGPTYDSEDVDMPDNPADKIKKNDHIINILLVGQDRRPGQGRQRSDAMILCTINTKTKTLTMTSFMRDLWVRIPGYYDERLNVPYAIGGFPLLNKTLEYQYGIHADYNVEVDFSGFEQVIDAVGGVQIYLTATEANIVNEGTGTLTEGLQTLNGTEALRYSRIRSIDSDFNRTSRQRTVLNALVEKAKGMSTTELYNLMLKVLPMVTVDMKDSEILSLIFKVGPILSDLKIVSQRIPLDDTYSFASIDGKSVLLLSPSGLKKNKEFIQQTLGK